MGLISRMEGLMFLAVHSFPPIVGLGFSSMGLAHGPRVMDSMGQVPQNQFMYAAHMVLITLRSVAIS